MAASGGSLHRDEALISPKVATRLACANSACAVCNSSCAFFACVTSISAPSNSSLPDAVFDKVGDDVHVFDLPIRHKQPVFVVEIRLATHCALDLVAHECTIVRMDALYGGIDRRLNAPLEA